MSRVSGRNFLLTIFLIACLHCALGVVRAASPTAIVVPVPGTTINSRNLGGYASLAPSALAFAIEHGLTVHIVPTQRIAWPHAYQAATEQYSGQVRLDSHDSMQNYVAGLPFPLIDPTDPKAAAKIAYDWHWGPFIPPQVTLRAKEKTRAWRIDPLHPGILLDDDAHSDFRNEGSCEQITIVRYMHTLEQLADAHHYDSPVEYKQRGDYCGPEPNAYIMIQYLDPARSSDAWFFPSAIRRWRRMKWLGGYPHQSCTYACASFWWEYVPPKTEAYSYKLLGEQPQLACLNASGTRVGIQRHENASRFGHIDCEVRSAWVLEMSPRSAPENILPAKLLVDKETYLFLGAEFYRGAAPEGLVPMWARKGSDPEEVRMELTDDFYVPSDRPLFFLSLNMDEESNVIDWDPPSNNLFDPKAQQYDPH